MFLIMLTSDYYIYRLFFFSAPSPSIDMSDTSYIQFAKQLKTSSSNENIEVERESGELPKDVKIEIESREDVEANE